GQALLFLIDIDNFKKINDTMGHAFGDEVLKTIGAKLKMEFRKSDICGRVGGDEMLIFLKDIEDGRLQCEAERVIAIYKNFGVGEYVKYTVTASIGAAVYSRDGKTFEELYKAADQALYRAKRNGKNQLMFYKKGNAENEQEEHS
ncbi:MAG: GGDEF domain-containing protein, partial [Lachnospiraceae bacterium]